MAKKKTARKSAPRAAAKPARSASARATGKRSGGAKSSGSRRPAAKASRHKSHAKGAGARSSGSRHAPRKSPGRKGSARTSDLFAQALDMAQSGFLFDAISAFKALADDASSDVADDAQCNVGLCYLRMHLYRDALEAFDRVIHDHPDATIAQVAGASHEFGRTAAKARLGRVHAFLGLGDLASARAECEAMGADRESHVVAPDGARRTFHELAEAAAKAGGA